MGRKVRRVPLDFQWPLNKTWKGFINPYPGPPQCEKCDGSGYSPEAKEMNDRWYGFSTGSQRTPFKPFTPDQRGSTPLTPSTPAVYAFAKRNVEYSPEYYGPSTETNIIREAQRLCNLWNAAWSHHLNQDDVDALVAGSRLTDLTHDWIQGKGWTPKDPPVHPTAEQVNIWSLSGFGHDSINCHIVVKAECERLGVMFECGHCFGHGYTWGLGNKDRREDYENWTEEEPPEGEGWQIWETVSEGSPITPVFATAEELATHMGEVGDPVHGKEMNAAQWLAWITNHGESMSMILSGDQMMSGAAALVQRDDQPTTS